MKTSQRLTGAALAVAAAGMLMTTGVGTVYAQEGKMLHCEGVNACKGKNDCKSGKNACKGQGACKGQSFVGMTKEQCEKVGGKVAMMDKKGTTDKK